MPTGTVTGHVTDASGAPAATVRIEVRNLTTGSLVAGFTDDSGAYRVATPPGQFTVSFGLLDGPIEFAHGKLQESEADTFTVAVGEQTVVDEQLPPTGSISGRFTDENGKPVAGEEVDAEYPDGLQADSAFTDENGEYTIPKLFAGDYRVQFFSEDFTRSQWATGKTTLASADVFTVSAGNNTVVSDQALATGTLVVTATDARTGEAIATFCANIETQGGCSDGSGQVLITGVQPGTHEIFVSTDDQRYFQLDTTVTVVGGQTLNFAAQLRPGAIITATVTDAATGAPVSGACTSAQPAGTAILPENGQYCSDDRGQITMGPLEAGSYNVFAFPDGNYGAQWVGPRGGTGNELAATVVKASVGTVATMSPIKLDPAGSLTGTVTDRLTGAPIPFALVALNTEHFGTGGGTTTTLADGDGHYTLGGLGPYNWPILAAGGGDAAQWSGGTPDRYLATPVRVTAGSSTVYNPALVQDHSTLRGTVRTASDQPASGGFVSLHNAVTGDIMASAFVGPDGSFSVPVLGPQFVKVEFGLDQEQGTQLRGWYGGADQAHAKVVVIPQRGSVTITIITS